MPATRPVAALVTVYHKWSHADVIVGKFIEGPLYNGRPFFDGKVVSLYVDQVPKEDLSRALAAKYNIRLCKSIDEALTLGSDKLAVEGVLSIGEHGTYPTNANGQILYPRRRFFEEVAKTFARIKRVVPVFTDKHLAATWDDAKWMYDGARNAMIPLMAGSSVPVAWRRPELSLPMGCEITEAVALGYGPFEGYGFHALEGLQCMVERRKGGEVGVKAVQALMGKEMWAAADRGLFSSKLVEETLKRSPAHAKGDYREITARDAEAGVWLIEYRDGLKAAVAMMNGYIYEGPGGSFCFACQLKGEAKPKSCQFYLQEPDPFAHFTELGKAIDTMFRTGHPPYPVERTLLTTGILDAIMRSRKAGGKRIETPHLAIAYKPTDWPFAKGEIPKEVKR